MILLYEDNMVSVPETAVVKLLIQQPEEHQWNLVLQINNKVVDTVLESDDFIDDPEEEDTRDRVLRMFNWAICNAARAMASEKNDDTVYDLGSRLRWEIAQWEEEFGE